MHGQFLNPYRLLPMTPRIDRHHFIPGPHFAHQFLRTIRHAHPHIARKTDIIPIGPRFPAHRSTLPARRPAVKTRPPLPRPASTPARKPWSRKQEKLALLYNEQGLRPAEIADKLGVSSYLVTQIILAAKNRGKL